MGKDRLSILKRIEQGEISIEEAKEILGLISDRNISPANQIKEEKEKEELDETSAVEKSHVPTRQERKLALAEKFQAWDPETMIALEKDMIACQWPWPDKAWKWMWQNQEYPIYINHSIELSEETQIKVTAYYGDIFIRGWDQPKLQINGAIFDLRIGQDANIVNIASSTGQIQIWVPGSVTEVDAKVIPGDMWLSNITANANLNCQSGDLGCEHVKGNIKILINGGDARLVGINGDIFVDSTHGNTDVRNIQSRNVIVKAEKGDISLNLNSVVDGNFQCQSNKGNIDLITGGEMSYELLVEATEGGRIAPIIIPWNLLLERSQYKLHGIIKDGGASVNLITRRGIIYIQESWGEYKI